VNIRERSDWWWKMDMVVTVERDGNKKIIKDRQNSIKTIGLILPDLTFKTYTLTETGE